MKTNLRQIICIIWCLALLTACTVVPIDEEGNLIGVSEVFNPEDEVASIWGSKVIPAFEENAIPVEDILAALSSNPQEAREKYGRQAAVGGPYTFMTTGEGKVIGIDGSNLLIDLAPYDGKEDLAIKIGPVFTGTEVRDALDFIKFKDYRDVTQYFAIANELNKKVRTEVVNDVDKATILDKIVEFYGAFGLKDKNDIIVIPVIFEVR